MWEKIVERIEVLKSLDNNNTLRHRYDSDPPVSPERMAEVEKELGVVFPTELRNYYLEVGNGGAGPDTGIWPIEDLQHFRPQQDWPGIDYIDDADEWESESRISGATTIMGRYYAHDNLIVMNGPDAGQIIAYDPLHFIFVENESLIALYEAWLDESIGYYDRLKDLIVSGAGIQEIAQIRYDGRGTIHPENTLTDVASLLNFPFPYHPDALEARSIEKTADSGTRIVIEDNTRRMFDGRLKKYRSGLETGFLASIRRYLRR